MRNSVRWLIVLGCGLRLFHYFRDPSVWHDEAALMVNVLRNDFRQLLGPLLWNEAGPPLFLWLERAVALVIGDGPFALRLVSVLAGCGSMVLFGITAPRWLPPRGAFWAVMLFAVSDRLLWHSCEAKPYAVDVFLAAALLAGFTLSRGQSVTRRLLTLIALTPPMIFVSYPACFLCGGLWIALLSASLRSAHGRDRVLHGLWAATIVASFAVLYFGPIRAQRTGAMEECWVGHFPNWSRPWTVPLWSVVNTFEVFRYDFQPWGNLLAGLAIAGSVALWRRGQRTMLVTLAAPLGLAWLASCLGGYPYGGSRLEAFAAPALAMLLGAGVDPIRDRLQARWRVGYAIVPLLLLAPAAWSARFVVAPWPRADAEGASRYIQAHRRPGEAVAANHWEYVYYFRHDPGELPNPDAGLPAGSSRVWVAYTAPDREIRRKLVESLAARGTIVERREFEFTVVLLLDLNRTPRAQH